MRHVGQQMVLRIAGSMPRCEMAVHESSGAKNVAGLKYSEMDGVRSNARPRSNAREIALFWAFKNLLVATRLRPE